MAEESCNIINSHGFYPDRRDITEEYQQQWLPVIAVRLAIAADRLARVLNQVPPE